MTRRKKPSTTTSTTTSNLPSKPQSKSRLRNFEDTDGWTHVSRNKKPKSSNGNATLFVSALQHCDMTLAELRDEHARHRRRWEGSEACVQLKAQLGVQRTKHEGRAVDNVVCLALGSPSNIHMDRRQDSHFQLAALETIREELCLKSMPCITQDPVFDALDKEFLTGLGYEVQDDPYAFEAINAGSLVYMIHPERSMYTAVLSRAQPAVFVSQDLSDLYTTDDVNEQMEETVETVDGELRSFSRACEVVPFPQLGYTFSGVVIHWRKVVSPTPP